MGKIKAYEYPDYKLSDCIGWASKLIDALKGDVSDENRVATILGHKAPKGGAFNAKMISLERWGLIERGKRVTELAETIIKPRNELEKRNAVLQCIQRIKLFKEIHDRYPDKIPEENFWEVLVAITGASRSEATKKEDSILKIYKDAIDYLDSIKIPEMEVVEVKPPAPPTQAPLTVVSFPIALPKFDVLPDALQITIPLSIESIEFAEKQIPIWLKEAKKQIESKKEALKEEG